MRQTMHVLVMAIGIISSASGQQAAVPFDLCVQSNDWRRPSAAVQSRIWNDPRYKDVAPTPYEWTHRFLWSEPDSASIAYHQKNMSGLWTDVSKNQCPRRDQDRGEWREIWALNYHVAGISLTGLVYTIAVVSQGRGYEFIQFREPVSISASKPTFRVVDDAGKTLAEWVESSPGNFAPVS